VCAPFLLEAGWSARSATHHDDLLRLPRVTIDNTIEDVALTAEADLAQRGHHRTATPSDLLIAACAHATGAGVLH
jgi:predicted nucleic acid-binding protein